MTDDQLDELAALSWSLRLSDLQESYRVADQLLKEAQSRNYKPGIAAACRTFGYCYWRFSDYSLSLSNSLRALEIYQELGNKRGEADTLNSVGAVYMFQEDHEKRLEVNLRCKELRAEIGDREGVASSEGNIGETYLEMGDLESARTCFQNCLVDSYASPQGRAWAYHNLGKVALIEKNYFSALDYYQKGLGLSQSVDYNVLVVDSYLRITELYIETKQYDEAIEYAERGLEVSRRIGAKEGEKKSLYYLSMVYELLGLFEKSLRYHKDYHTIDIEISRDTEIERLKTAQLKIAYDKIEDQKNELVDSIRYAERIQTALLTRDQEQRLMKDFFVVFEPKDIVSGDFYWYYEKDNEFYVAVADCTGHGVPGAFLTMLGTTFLNEILALNDDASPAFILERLRQRMMTALKSGSSKDGMDISLLRVNPLTGKAEWAGAYNPLWIVRSRDEKPLESTSELQIREGQYSTLFELKADKFPIGSMDHMGSFTNHEIQLEADDSIYLFSDGFSDQFGGTEGKKFLSGRFKDVLLGFHSMAVDRRKELLSSTFEEWKGKYDQVDDVCVLGFQFSPVTG